jgi:NADH-quinone oxidoreductase subunit D
MSLTGFEVEVQRPDGGGLDTEEMTLNMGPQHPSTHGVLRFVVKADGEVMREAIADVGYLHRSIEKISE